MDVYLTSPEEYLFQICAALDLARAEQHFFTEKCIMKQEKGIRVANYTSESISTRLSEDGI